MKRLMDIYTRSDVAGREAKMTGRVILDSNSNHFEGIVRRSERSNYHLVAGDMVCDKDYGLIELTIFQRQGSNRPSLKLEGEKYGFRFVGKSYLKTDEAMVECGNSSVGIYDGDLIREVTDSEIEYVEQQTMQAIQELNEDSLNQYMSLSDTKQYQKRMPNK